MERHNPQAIFEDPLITAWRCDAPLRLILVCTTSIQETGRDHDYDWAITEPWSIRSLVQLAGRVLRHRDIQPATPNIGVLERELAQLTPATRGHARLELGREPLLKAAGKVLCYDALTAPSGSRASQPKVWAAFSKRYPQCGEPAASRKDAFSTAFFDRGITAEPCLSASVTPASGWLTFLEHRAQKIRMSADSVRTFYALEDYVQPHFATGIVEASWGRHNAAIQFRHQEGARAQFSLDPAATDCARHTKVVAVQKNPITRALSKQPLVSEATSPALDVSRFLIPLPRPTASEWAALRPIGGRELLLFAFEITHHEKAATDDTRYADSRSLRLDYHPLLGADLQRKQAL